MSNNKKQTIYTSKELREMKEKRKQEKQRYIYIYILDATQAPKGACSARHTD